MYVLNRPTVAVDPDGKRVYFIGGAGNDQDGWNYINRWAQAFYSCGIEGSFYRVNSSRGKNSDMSFTFNWSNTGYKTIAHQYSIQDPLNTPMPPISSMETVKGEFSKNEYIDRQVEAYQKHLENNPLAEGGK